MLETGGREVQAGEFVIFNSKSEPKVNCSFIEVVCAPFFPVLSMKNLFFQFCFMCLFFMCCLCMLYALVKFT